MAKPDMFRILGCIVMVTLILVIAVKLSKQCMVQPPMSTPSVTASSSSTPSGSSTPACKAGYTPNENGFCMPT
jgi:hypothetical protein